MRQLTPIGLSLLLATAALGQQSSPQTLDLKGAIAVALRESPMVASARRAAENDYQTAVAGMKEAVAASEAGIRAAKSSSLPQVFLQADYQNITEGAHFPRQENTATVGLAVRLPIWDSGRTKSKVSEAKSLHDKAVEDLRAVRQSAELETKAAESALVSARYNRIATNYEVQIAQVRLLTSIGRADLLQ